MASVLLLCLFLCGYYCSIALGRDGHNFAVVLTNSLEPDDVCSTSKVTPQSDRATMPLVHRHGPCAPVQTNGKPSFAETLRRDRARTNHIISRASRRMSTLYDEDGDDVSIPTYLGTSVDSLEYVITVGFGTPAVPQIVLIDTGSDLTWIQCKPCNSSKCYPQKDPLFDPSKSSSYTPIPCESSTCKNITSYYGNGCTGSSQCGYAIGYGDGSNTTGVYSNDTLTLTAGAVVESFRFGCGHDQEGPNDKFDGLIGLGGAPESLVSQTSHVYGGAFSYCLPPTESSAGFLALGAPSNTSGFVFTPMLRLPDMQTFYKVTLAGISLAGRRLDIPPSVFLSGMIVDSGTVVTALPATAYAALRSEFRSAMAGYPFAPPAPPVDYLDTCYNFTGYSNVTVPRVALTFTGGATIELNTPSGILVKDCLAFVGIGTDNYTGIVGNVNQRTFEVLYDVGRGNVGFRHDAC